MMYNEWGRQPGKVGLGVQIFSTRAASRTFILEYEVNFKCLSLFPIINHTEFFHRVSLNDTI